MAYSPPAEILDKYAKLLVNFALGGGSGIKPGEVIYLQSSLSALPLYNALRRVILDSGGLVISSLTEDASGFNRYFYEHATKAQLSIFLNKYYRGLVDQINYRLAILADYDLHELDGIDPKKIMLSQKAQKPFREWLDQKENSGLYTWCLALYGTPAMAREAGLSEKSYWDQIIKACYLDYANPIDKWRKIYREIYRIASRLTELKIEKVHVVGEDLDLHLIIGPNRRWVGGGGRNIPSYEIFTSPDWRGTEGWVRFNQPLYRFGVVVKGVELYFKNGRVVKSKASQNEQFLKQMLSTDAGASQIGEFSLTDKRLSRITKFMAETLYDENRGGRYGNTHLAIGRSFMETYNSKFKKIPSRQAESLGFSQSAIHTDLVSTSNRQVRALLRSGQELIIYKNGQFMV